MEKGKLGGISPAIVSCDDDDDDETKQGEEGFMNTGEGSDGGGVTFSATLPLTDLRAYSAKPINCSYFAALPHY